eukprot:3932977-Rhodomonas_salina.1
MLLDHVKLGQHRSSEQVQGGAYQFRLDVYLEHRAVVQRVRGFQVPPLLGSAHSHDGFFLLSPGSEERARRAAASLWLAELSFGSGFQGSSRATSGTRHANTPTLPRHDRG